MSNLFFFCQGIMKSFNSPSPRVDPNKKRLNENKRDKVASSAWVASTYISFCDFQYSTVVAFGEKSFPVQLVNSLRTFCTVPYSTERGNDVPQPNDTTILLSLLLCFTFLIIIIQHFSPKRKNRAKVCACVRAWSLLSFSVLFRPIQLLDI